MKYIMIFRANLHYAYLVPERYEFVIRNSYELILDTIKEFDGVKFVLEASGYTIEQIAEKTPDVLEKLKEAIHSGRCEFMGSPYAHPMLPNFAKEDGLWSLKFSRDSYRKHLGVAPRSFGNPETGWRSFVAEQVFESGYANLLCDFETYSRSSGPDGKPLRPEIYEKEHRDDEVFYHFGLNYDLPGAERTLHFPFEHIHGIEDGKLRVFLRSDRLAQFVLRYFMGQEGYTFEDYMELVQKYSQQNPGEPEGALIIFEDDAEYVGTNAWFRLKYESEPDHVFEKNPDSKEKLRRILTACSKLGEFITYDQACNDLPALDETVGFDEDSAWHGAKASTWARTPMARLLRAWQDLVRDKLKAQSAQMDPVALERAWYYLTNSYNSDGQWPPTLPQAPHIVHPFNYGYCFENLLAAETLVGGVDRTQLTTDPVATIKEILTPQQNLVLEKAKTLLNDPDAETAQNARLARAMITRSQDVTSIVQSGGKVLYPAEYRVRADALAEARRLVGGIVIETDIA